MWRRGWRRRRRRWYPRWVLALARHELGVGRRDDADDDTEQTEGTAKDLNDQNLDEEVRVLGIGQGASGTDDSDANTVQHTHVTFVSLSSGVW